MPRFTNPLAAQLAKPTPVLGPQRLPVGGPKGPQIAGPIKQPAKGVPSRIPIRGGKGVPQQPLNMRAFR